MGTHSQGETTRGVKPFPWVLWIVIFVVALSAGGAGGYFLATNPFAADAPESSLTASPEATETEKPAPPATPVTPTVQLPENCEGLFSRSMLSATAASYGPVQTGVADRMSTKDPALEAIVKIADGLHCSWAPTGDAGGINTSVLHVDANTTLAITRHLQANEYECGASKQGFLCTKTLSGPGAVSSDPNTSAAELARLPRSGESHLLREGIWISTYWSQHIPNGYTLDISRTLFGS